MSTFYTFKNKVNEPEPLVKNPGEVEGQVFEIGDCENSTLVVMDFCDQVQIDQVKNSRIFIGACSTSIFIRNCSDCIFYTCSRQLRLRDVVNCTLYTFSMAEVHIEDSNNVKFAPFNGGYPDHAKHLAAANLDTSHNLWYDVFDHSDPQKTRVNWSLLEATLYEPQWFPAGTPCPLALERNEVGSVVKQGDEGMQSFSRDQVMAQAVEAPPAPPAQAPAPAPAAEVTPAPSSAPSEPAEVIAPPAPPSEEVAPESGAPPLPPAP